MTLVPDCTRDLPSRVVRAALLLIIVAAGLVYLPHVHNELVFDDHPQVRENPYVKGEEPWDRAFSRDVWAHKAAELGSAYKYYRPLYSVALRVAYQAGGGAPWAFHGLSFLLHAGAVLLIWQVLRRLRFPSGQALAGAALVALTPLAGEVVYWTSCVSEGLVLVGLLATLLCMLAANEQRGPRRHLLLAGAATSLLLSLLAKETAVIIPVILSLEVLRHPGEERWARLQRLAPLWLLTAGFLWVRAAILGASGLGALLPDLLHSLGRFGLALLWYLRQLIFPYPLTPFHPFPSAPGPLAVCAGVAAVAVVLILAGLLLRFRPGGLFWLGWLVLPLALPLIQLFFAQRLSTGVVVAERYLYLSLVPWFALVVRGGAGLLDALPARARCAVGAGLLAGLILPGAIFGHAYGRAFDGDAAYFGRAYETSPDNAFVLLWLGKLRIQAGEYGAALPLLERGIALEPRLTALHANRGVVLAKLGQTQAAAAALRTALEQAPTQAGLHLALGDVLRDLGRIDEAGAAYRQELAIDPGSAPALLNLGTYRFLKGDPAGAVDCWEQSLARDPRQPDVLFNLGMAYRAMGEKAQAARYLQRFLAEADASYREQRAQAESWLRE